MSNKQHFLFQFHSILIGSNIYRNIVYGVIYFIDCITTKRELIVLSDKIINELHVFRCVSCIPKINDDKLGLVPKQF
jgi:hypothetical protein